MRFIQEKVAMGLLLAITGLTTLPLCQAADNAVQPPDPEQLFQVGMEQRESGDIETAIKAFQSILDLQPTLHRARLELARAYFQALNYTEAKAQAERVLNDPSVPEGVKVRIRQFLEQLTVQFQRHTWTPYVSLGYQYDSNASAGPNSNVYEIGAAAITLNADALKRGDHGTVLTASLSHRYMSPNTVRVGDRNAAFLWQSQVSVYRLDYNKANAFDLNVASLSTGPAWIAARHWRGNISLQVDRFTLGSDTYGTFTGVTPAFTKIFAQGRTEVTIDSQWQTREYSRAVDAGRDSHYRALGMMVGQLLPGDKVSVQIGLVRFDENADREEFANHGNELYAGANWRVSPRMNVYGRASKRDSHFEADDPVFLQRRDGEEKRSLLGTTYTFSGGLLTKWALSATHARTDNDSSIAAYTYDRRKSTVSLGRSF
jgi:hypothetical protein